ncbi:TRAP transporter substrate-binding protein DctP [Marinobacter zhanjiangensis]|uniref:ABC transporter substrate-binding protein n=1 Tax=Marinobacter zhanjiangensis TaxID=578215 RepID=A0ABQ3B1T8_9GAMM|nr:TRAP transporter substrate-binding protein DctP [Marinobacter zhanjiangensis]GGY75361.1 ABC transporter substrate-binding protein [Marinobacter zhanjiangensis]
MKARHFGALMLAIASGLLLPACSDNDSPMKGLLSDEPEPEIWRFALEEIGGSVQDAWAQEFRRRIEVLSDGQVQVEVYPYGSIGTSPQLTRLVKDGRVHLAFASPGHVADDIPEAGIFLLPFLFPENDRANRRILADDELRALLQAGWQDAGLQLLDLVPEGWMMWTADRALHTPEDFSGLRMRTMTAPQQAEVFRAWGAEPVPLPYSEVYDALQLGQVDGQSNPVFAIAEMNFHEVQSVMTVPRATRFVASVVSNRNWHQNLNEEHRQWLEAARSGMPEFIDEIQRDYNRRHLQQLRESGRITVEPLTDDQRARFRDASLPARDAYRERAGERGERLLQRVQSLSGQQTAD